VARFLKPCRTFRIFAHSSTGTSARETRKRDAGCVKIGQEAEGAT
jgi:hypothetical protein